jgi:hypothetical protein
MVDSARFGFSLVDAYLEQAGHRRASKRALRRGVRAKEQRDKEARPK